MHGITITMKYRFKALPVNSWGYYEVRERYEVMRRHGLDRYMASLTRIALMDKHETVETTMKNQPRTCQGDIIEECRVG